MSENKNIPAIAINNQYIKDLSLEIPLAPEIFKEVTSNPQIDIEVNTDAKKLHDNVFNATLSLAINGDIKGKKLFILELVYEAVVTLNVPEEHVEPVLMIEIPRILFPFARSIITNTLVNGGLPPFLLNPIDFAAVYQGRKGASGTVN